MDPTFNFTLSIQRFELTNVDVGALRDLGWETMGFASPVPEPSSSLLLVLAGGILGRRRHPQRKLT